MERDRDDTVRHLPLIVKTSGSELRRGHPVLRTCRQLEQGPERVRGWRGQNSLGIQLLTLPVRRVWSQLLGGKDFRELDVKEAKGGGKNWPWLAVQGM